MSLIISNWSIRFKSQNNKIMKKVIFLSSILGFVPFVTFAADMKSLTGIINFLSDTLAKGVLPLLIGIAVVAFVYGIIEYFLNPDNEEKRKKGKSFILWGLIALFVMVSFWGIVGVLQNTFQTTDNSAGVKIPSIPDQLP